jgi:hypothetical protein
MVIFRFSLRMNHHVPRARSGSQRSKYNQHDFCHILRPEFSENVTPMIAPIAIDFCRAAKCRDVPLADILGSAGRPARFLAASRQGQPGDRFVFVHCSAAIPK